MKNVISGLKMAPGGSKYFFQKMTLFFKKGRSGLKLRSVELFLFIVQEYIFVHATGSSV